jgi:hypothetical protein
MKRKQKPKPRNPKPFGGGSGPAANKRVANKPFKPARQRTYERAVPFDTVPLDLPGPYCPEVDPDRFADDAPERDE